MKKRILWIVVDIAAATLIMVGVWGFNYLIPQKGVSAVPMQSSFTKNTNNQDTLMEKMEEQTDIQMEDTGGQNASLQRTNITMDTQDWHKKFADKFTDQVVSTDTSYTGPNVSVQLFYHQ